MTLQVGDRVVFARTDSEVRNYRGHGRETLVGCEATIIRVGYDDVDLKWENPSKANDWQHQTSWRRWCFEANGLFDLANPSHDWSQYLELQ